LDYIYDSNVSQEQKDKIQAGMAKYWEQYYSILEDACALDPETAMKKLHFATINGKIILQILEQSLGI